MSSKPNILIFMTDQQRGDTVLPGSSAKMPNVERFRQEGVLFSQAHCPSPHCCPSRATFFTGLQPSVHGVWHNVNVDNAISRGLSDHVKTWSEDFLDHGYQLFFSGKWHVSDLETPGDRGWQPAAGNFDYLPVDDENEWHRYEGLPQKPEGYQRQPGEIVRPGYPTYLHYGRDENPFNDLAVVRTGQSRIETLAHSNEPWMLFVGTVGPHDPYFVPQRFLDRYPLDEIAGLERKRPVNQGDKFVDFALELIAGETQLQTFLTDANGINRGAYYVYVELI